MKAFYFSVMTMLLTHLINSTQVNAQENNYDAIAVFVKSESHNKDTLSSIGISALFKNPRTNFGLKVNTAIGTADIHDDTLYKQEYLSWEAGIKIGYFSKLFFYGELGVDLAEFILHDRDDEYESYDRHHHHDNDVDGYIGMGAGINFGKVQLEAFTRLRQIDSDGWKAQHFTYSGVQLSLSF